MADLLMLMVSPTLKSPVRVGVPIGLLLGARGISAIPVALGSKLITPVIPPS